MRSFKQYLTEVHYTDLYGKAFEEFKKKYIKLGKDDHTALTDLWIQFTNYADNTLDRTAFDSPDHKDPQGTYAYPIEYVLKNPADIWYGSNAKYLRVLESKVNRRSDKNFRAAHMTELEARRYLKRLFGSDYTTTPKGDVDTYDMIEKYIKKVFHVAPKYITPGKVLFFAIQHDVVSGTTEQDVGWGEKREKYTIFPAAEQTKRLLKLGFLAVEDELRGAASRASNWAVINPREPEQIVFLRRDAFIVKEVFQLKGKSDYIATTQTPEKNERKLAAGIAAGIEDRLTEGPETSSLGGWSYYWTKKGNRIEIKFERSQAYYDNKKMGEKRHKEDKLFTAHFYDIVVNTDIGKIKLRFDSNVKFVKAIAEIKLDYAELKKSPEKTEWVPEDKKQFKEKKEEEVRQYYRDQATKRAAKIKD